MDSDSRLRTGGILLVDKPAGMTSHDVVAAVRKHVRPLRVGHTGTLDPIASGLLILCVGEATKIAGFIEAQRKRYRATLLLGLRTDTLDVSGTVTSRAPVEALSEERVDAVARTFIGTIEQIPPAFSAIKVDGVRAYARARRSEDVQLAPRKVNIERLDIERIDLPRVQFVVECSKGTYIRSLCRDLGEALGVGGSLESLRRLEIGRFSLDEAVPLAELATCESVAQALLPASKGLASMPVLACTTEEVESLRHGMTLSLREPPGDASAEGSWAQALGADGELVAVGRLSWDGDKIVFHPKRVMLSGESR
jgi:tRNA pseudouridine55 synthase